MESRNLVVCLDGTTNEPETGFTNVARLFDVADKSAHQLVYYDPGVGTLGAPAAITPWGKALTRAAGMVAGHGIKDNIGKAYAWLARHYQAGDQVFIFGFSRGAYTARALAGMLNTVGLLRADADNLVPFAVKLYTKSGGKIPAPGAHPDEGTTKTRQEFWKLRREFEERFGNPEFPSRFDPSCKQVRFLGAWDTVKFVGWLNIKARIEVARWPFTANLANVSIARHALALDERRRPFAEYRFKAEAVADSDGRLEEVWFAGVHGDIGGQSRGEDRLPDVAFAWMVHEAKAAGLLINKRRYERVVGVGIDQALPEDRALGRIRPNAAPWILCGGWRTRTLRPGDTVHPSVVERIRATSADTTPYRPTNVPPALIAPDTG